MTQTAITYGHALFELAHEGGALQEYMADLKVISYVLDDNPQFLPMLDSRSISLAERLSTLDECFSGQIAPYVLNFMKLLCQNAAILELPACIRQFTILYNESCGILEVKAVSAVPLSPALQEKLQKKLQEITGKTVVISYVEDPEVLGGLRLCWDGKELDGTVRRRLDEFGKNLAELTL